jgi:hypothetical protein
MFVLSVQAICGAVVGSVAFAIGVTTWLRDRRNDNSPDTTSRFAPGSSPSPVPDPDPAPQKRAAVRS